MNPDITAVEPVGGWRLRLTFEDGERREVDIAALVEPTGVFEALNDPDFFRRVRVNPELGTIVWPNGADLCPDVLHRAGRLLAPARQRAG